MKLSPRGRLVPPVLLVLAPAGWSQEEVRAESAPAPRVALRDALDLAEARYAQAIETAGLSIGSGAAFTAGIARWVDDLPQIHLDGETYWVAEGDLLLDTPQLSDYAFERELTATARRVAAGRSPAEEVADDLRLRATGLIGGATDDGRHVYRWRPGKILSYRIAKGTFPSEEHYEQVVTELHEAADGWEALCGVDFEHLVELDEREGIGPEGSVFCVRYVERIGGPAGLVALAFFPWEDPQRRRVLLTPGFFRTAYSRVGILRHELGHALGFRHEHIRSGAPPDCPGENAVTFPFTDYDPTSVMHYFCGGVGTRELAFTERDREGARALYGMPLAQLRFVD